MLSAPLNTDTFWGGLGLSINLEGRRAAKLVVLPMKVKSNLSWEAQDQLKNAKAKQW